MNKEMFGVGLRVLIVVIFVFVLHFVLFASTDIGESMRALGYNLPVLYILELVFTVSLLVALYTIKELLPHSLGYVFLGFITLRLIVSYIYISAGLNDEAADDVFKFNFLTVVLVFISLDAYIAYNVLNKIDAGKTQE